MSNPRPSLRSSRPTLWKVSLALLTLLLSVGGRGTAQEGCFELTLGHTGSGADPMATALGSGTTWGSLLISDVFEDADTPAVVDMDGDGDLDIFASSSSLDLIGWLENVTGDGTVWVRHVITNSFVAPGATHVVDFDRDGDLDVVAAATAADRIRWWENLDGLGTAWSEHSVDEFFQSPRSVFAADLDGDTDLDLLVASDDRDALFWLVNIDGAGTSFEQRVVSRDVRGARSALAHDLDGDGDLDLLASANSDDRVLWWDNAFGDGSEWIQHDIDSSFEAPQQLLVSDLDGDGDPDVAGASRTANATAWWENTDGDAGSWVRRPLQDGIEEIDSIYAADLDGDGDEDVLGANENAVVWWENVSGDGSAWSERLVELGFSIASIFVAAGDLDGDGDVDVTGVRQFYGELIVWENLGSDACPIGSFPAGSRVGLDALPDDGSGVEGWTGTDSDGSRSLRNALTMPASDTGATVHYREGCFTLNLSHTGDGLDPIPSPASSPACPTGQYLSGELIALTATPDDDREIKAWTGTEDDLATTLENTLSMPPADHAVSIDYGPACHLLTPQRTGAGATPLAEPASSPSCAPGFYETGERITLAATPDPNWEVGAWANTDDDTSRELTNELTMPSGHAEPRVDYVPTCFPLTLEHVGPGTDPIVVPLGEGDPWRDLRISEPDLAPRALDLVDIDGDGDGDLVAAHSSDQLSWWENEVGDGSSWSEHLILESILYRFDTSVSHLDFDDDGDPDLLLTGRFDNTAWIENVAGDGSLWAEHVVDGSFDNPYDMAAGDLDGDGDLDLTGAGGNATAWFENLDGLGLTWQTHTLDTVWIARSVAVIDLDGDGDLDFVQATDNISGVLWWENVVGDGSEWIDHVIDGFSDGVSIAVADLDEDGDPDLVASSTEIDEVAWWENVAGDASEWAKVVIDPFFDGAEEISIADLDRDGDLDIAGSSSATGHVVWWENLGGDLTSWPQRTIANGLAGADTVAIGDLDADGDLDVAASSEEIDTILWSSNLPPADCPAGEATAEQVLTLRAAPGPGIGISGWTGTDDDASRLSENTLTMPAAAHTVSVSYLEGCFDLELTHSGLGADPIATPPSSDGCAAGTYVSGEPIELAATPDPGWDVGGWLGTDDDASRASTNTLVMPAGDHLVEVIYTETCYALELIHVGLGADPSADPTQSPGCDPGTYLAGAVVELTAVPDPNWQVTGWRNTDDDTRTELTNRVTMPDRAWTAGVFYSGICRTLSVAHTGDGSDPELRPVASEGCPVGQFVTADVVELLAAPSEGWGISGWTGTDDDERTNRNNQVTMPETDHLVTVAYVEGCFLLTPRVLGPGALPTLDPEGSVGCENGRYNAGEIVVLTAAPDTDAEVLGWIGTDDDNRLDLVNEVTMPALDHDAGPIYDFICFDLELTQIGAGAPPTAVALGDGSIWTENAVATGVDGARAPTLVDLDGDGDLDAAGVANDGDAVLWWENLDGTGLDWLEHTIDDSLAGASAVTAADLDGDGDLDVAATGFDSDEVVWWRNLNGVGTSWARRLIDENTDRAEDVAAADVDGDGDVDLLTASSGRDQIALWENGGDGSTWTKRTIDDDFDGAFSVSTADLDGDSDIDLLAAAFAADDVAWWENLAGDGTSWAKRPIDPDVDGPQSVVASDLDGDGDLDVIAVSILSDSILWWENQRGDGSAWARTLVDDSLVGAASVAPGDIDGDGDVDLLASGSGSRLDWWENLDRDGIEWAAHPLTEAAVNTLEVALGDLDGDGDLDALVSSATSDRFGAWANDSSPSCEADAFHAGDRVSLTAEPDPSWGVERWEGTDDDDLAALSNTLSMPSADHTVAVHYVEGCFALSLTHNGPGADPVASLSPSCRRGTHAAAEVITVRAEPDPGAGVSGWSGTLSDTASTLLNEVSMPPGDHTVGVDYLAACFELELTHGGLGSDPIALPDASPGCADGEYVVGESIQVEATPDPNWEISGWIGTENDESDRDFNTVTMPANDLRVEVLYQEACFSLGLRHLGEGSDPAATPEGSDGCTPGGYHSGEEISLVSTPALAWTVAGWRGTDDDDSREPVNSLTMPPGDFEAGVLYELDCFELALEHTGQGDDPIANLLGNGTEWVEGSITTNSSSIRVAAGDIDGDGDLDLALTESISSGLVSWQENEFGDGSSWISHPIDFTMENPSGIFLTDFDGDGALDVLARNSESIIWWRNLARDGTTWAAVTVDADGFYGTWDIADIDSDGDTDIVAMDRTSPGDRMTWWQNVDGSGELWNEILVDTNDLSLLIAADFDGDGDPDLAGWNHSEDDSIFWWENTAGDGSSWQRETLSVGVRGDDLFAADLDGDGDLDLLHASALDEIGWWENVAGDASVWTRHVLGELADADLVSAADLDGDGDLDVVGIGNGFSDEAITWWENTLGDASEWRGRVIREEFGTVRDHLTADLDGDGDLDLVAGSGDTSWWRNVVTSQCADDEYRLGDGIGLVAAPAPGWAVGGWTGTDDDTSLEERNRVTMPPGDHVVSVEYVEDP